MSITISNCTKIIGKKGITIAKLSVTIDNKDITINKVRLTNGELSLNSDGLQIFKKCVS